MGVLLVVLYVAVATLVQVYIVRVMGEAAPRISDLYLAGVFLAGYLLSWRHALALLVASLPLALWITSGLSTRLEVHAHDVYRLGSYFAIGVLIIVLMNALHRSRRTVNALVEQAPDGIVVSDGGRIVEANRRACALLGYSRDELVGTETRDLVHPTEWERRELARQDLREGVPVAAAEWLVRTPSGEFRPFEVSACTLPDGRNQFILRDPGEHVAAAARQRLETVGALAAGIAHRFNNLLVGVMGNASLALDLDPEPPVRKCLDQIVRSSQSAAELVAELLTSAGKTECARVPLWLHDLVTELEPQLVALVPDHVALRWRLEPHQAAIEGDPDLLRQLVVRLVQNAVEAIGDEAGFVEVRTTTAVLGESVSGADGTVLPPGRYVGLEVEDTGAGMDEATRAHALEPFFSTKFPGRGLGLAAVHGIVAMHGGRIEIRSESGRGTTVSILFPVR